MADTPSRMTMLCRRRMMLMTWEGAVAEDSAVARTPRNVVTEVFSCEVSGGTLAVYSMFTVVFEVHPPVVVDGPAVMVYTSMCYDERNTANGQFRPQWGFSSIGRAPALHAGGQGFDSPKLHKSPHETHTRVAQRIEHLTTDQKVGGSNPSVSATLHHRPTCWGGVDVF